MLILVGALVQLFFVWMLFLLLPSWAWKLALFLIVGGGVARAFSLDGQTGRDSRTSEERSSRDC